MTKWTSDNQAEWNTFWEGATGQAGLRKIKDDCRVPGGPIVAVAGVDQREIAAQAYSYAQGQSSVLEAIEKLSTPAKPHPALPPMFQPTPPPKQPENAS